MGLCVQSPIQTLSGRVVSVSNGDTITVLDQNNQQHKIRLNGVDAPESSQDFCQAANRNLSDLVFGKDVRVEWRKRDRYERFIGRVMIGGNDANFEQLRKGFAWYYIQYALDVPAENRPFYERAKKFARQSRRGLWQEPNPMPQWEFRHPEQISQPAQRQRQLAHLSVRLLEIGIVRFIIGRTVRLTMTFLNGIGSISRRQRRQRPQVFEWAEIVRNHNGPSSKYVKRTVDHYIERAQRRRQE